MQSAFFRTNLTFFGGAIVGIFLAMAGRATTAEDRTAPNENYFVLKVAVECFGDEKAASLAVAAARGDLERIDYLVAHNADPNARAKTDMTPLLWAIAAKSKAGFRRLLERGASPDYVAEGGDFNGFPHATPRSLIGCAAGDANDSEWLEILLKHGANPNLVHPKIGGEDTVDHGAGMTPMFAAVDSGRMTNLELLIRAGADVNHQDNVGETPMMHAAFSGRFAIVLRLLEAGADYRIRTNDGEYLAYRTALFEVPNDPSATSPDCKKVIAFLEGKGVDMRPARKKVEAWHRDNPHWKEFPSGK